jgi:cytochrome c2
LIAHLTEFIASRTPSRDFRIEFNLLLKRGPMMRNFRNLIAMAVLVAFVSPAFAIKPFYDVFKKDYLDTHKDKKFAESVDKAEGSGKCLICHQGKKSKESRNAFGKEVGKLLDRKKDARNLEKISAALKKALAAPIDPKKPKGETYMDRLKKSQWPGGKLEDLKKEPRKNPREEAAKKE